MFTEVTSGKFNWKPAGTLGCNPSRAFLCGFIYLLPPPNLPVDGYSPMLRLIEIPSINNHDLRGLWVLGHQRVTVRFIQNGLRNINMQAAFARLALVIVATSAYALMFLNIGKGMQQSNRQRYSQHPQKLKPIERPLAPHCYIALRSYSFLMVTLLFVQGFSLLPCHSYLNYKLSSIEFTVRSFIWLVRLLHFNNLILVYLPQ